MTDPLTAAVGRSLRMSSKTPALTPFEGRMVPLEDTAGRLGLLCRVVGPCTACLYRNSIEDLFCGCLSWCKTSLPVT